MITGRSSWSTVYAVLMLFVLLLIPVGGSAAGELSCEEKPDAYIMSNGLIKASVSRKNGSLDIFGSGGKLLSTYFSIGSEEFGNQAQGRYAVHAARPEKSADGSYMRLLITQDWGNLSLQEEVILPADRPYVYMKYILSPRQDFNCKHMILFALTSPGLDTRSYRSDKLYSISNTSSGKWYTYSRDFLNGGWMAFHSSGTGEGGAVLFNNPANWNSFVGAGIGGSDVKDGTFSVQYMSPYAEKKKLTPNDKIVMDFCLLAFKGDASTEAEKWLPEVRKLYSGVK